MLDLGYAIALIIIFTASFPILIVIFTIKRHGKVQDQNVQPPEQLQFHEQDEIVLNQLHFHESFDHEQSESSIQN